MEQSILIPRALRRDGIISRIAAVLSALPDDKAWRVDVCEQKSQRSQAQNRYLWGVCYPAIMKHLPGWDAEDVHEWCLGEHFGWETIEGFGKKRLRPIRRSSRLSVIEFRDYVDWMQRTMADRGIYIPDAATG